MNTARTNSSKPVIRAVMVSLRNEILLKRSRTTNADANSMALSAPNPRSATLWARVAAKIAMAASAHIHKIVMSCKDTICFSYWELLCSMRWNCVLK